MDKFLKVIKWIFLIITVPFWGPWKLLFGRRKNSESDSPLVKLGMGTLNVLKFFVFLFIMLIEVLVMHKIRYSPLTYGFTNNAVRDYYLNEARFTDAESGMKSSLENMLGIIDTWEMDEKNKMNVILNSELIKKFFIYTDERTLSYIIDKFNEDDTFRENLRVFVKNIDKNLTRFLQEIPEKDMDRLNSFISPIITVSSWAIDYAAALNIGDAVFDYEIKDMNIREGSLYASNKGIDKGIKTGIDFDKGASLKQVQNYW